MGFMPLVDCAPLVMASVLRLDERHGLKFQLSRESSWAGVRDKLLGGGLDMAQALYGLVYGVQLGVAGPQRDMAVLMNLNRNGQGISVSQRVVALGVTDLASLAQVIQRSPRAMSFAQTFPTGTHAMWLYYALAAVGVHPLRDVHSLVLPPAQMVAAMQRGQADGVSVGAPWNRLGVVEGVATPLLASGELWPAHPEKVLATTAALADREPQLCRAAIMAVLEASRWLEHSDANRLAAAEILAGDAFVATRTDAIADSLLGRCDDAIGGWRDAPPMRFHADGEVNFPYLSDGMWFMTQHKRWGLLAEHPDYATVAQRVQRLDLYREAAASLHVPLPSTVLRSSRLIDGQTWDGQDPVAYADSFALHSTAASPSL